MASSLPIYGCLADRHDSYGLVPSSLGALSPVAAKLSNSFHSTSRFCALAPCTVLMAMLRSSSGNASLGLPRLHAFLFHQALHLLGGDDFAPAGQHCKAVAVHKATPVWRFARLLGRLERLAQEARNGFADQSALHLRNLASLKQNIGFKVKGCADCGIMTAKYQTSP